ncbi:hypothetical protein [Mycolicibacterium sp. CR10]|uniref:hypothetical protein n=1 Tax=Mycolicibacterium sp. CR10 TaxID=2562314 RepID=UPI0010C01C2C|nr:hypothetical protein [Mycolicibacterium sp. CR10]
MSLRNESGFPVLDANREHQPGRVILDDLGVIEPYVDETDYWCAMPLRVSHSPTTHVAIEIGPYTIDSRDIEPCASTTSPPEATRFGGSSETPQGRPNTTNRRDPPRMTDNEHDDREAARQVFGNPSPIPADIVPTPGLTREDLERQSAAAMKPCTGSIPGQVICDVDGNPIGVEETRYVTAVFAGTAITDVQAEQLGITAGELPGIHIISTKGENR